METAIPPAQSHSNQRNVALASAVAISALGALLVLFFKTDTAVGGTFIERAAIPGRMLLLVMTATFLLRYAGENWRVVGLRAPTSPWRTAALIIGGYLAVGVAIALVTKILLPLMNFPQRTTILFADIHGNLGEYLYWLIPIAWGSAAVGEELVFRGFLQTRFERVLSSIPGAAAIAAFGQAIIFGLLHAYQGASGAIIAGVTGLIIGLIYIVSHRNLWICIILHGLIDTVSLTAIYIGVAS